MKSILNSLARQGVISSLSYYFAEFIAEQAQQPIDDLLALSAALLSEANQAGDVCIMLDRYANKALFSSERLESSDLPVGPDLESWRKFLLESNCVGKPGEVQPLILQDNRLYLYRYWFYETRVAEFIMSRSHDMTVPDIDRASSMLNTIYPNVGGQSVNQQKLAVALAIKSQFTVISGGPGTGKTTTVINILKVLLSQQPDLRIKLAAPTGKAAARMMESLRLAIESSSPDKAIVSAFPSQAQTIHRLLGYRKDGFRYSSQHPLPLDCIIIDEASMVDLTLMFHLLDALPSQARVILLGDRDQLASVAAGNVLADITGRGQSIAYSNDQIKLLEQIMNSALDDQTGINKPLSDSIALLTRSYRFESQSGIGRLAQMVNQGESNAMIELLKQQMPDLNWQSANTDAPGKVIIDQILSHYEEVVQSSSLEQAFDAFERSRVLCAIHSGPFGVEHLNMRITQAMLVRGWISADKNFAGKPILITTNDYELELFNGDIGLIWLDSNQVLRAYFRDPDQGLRSLPITSLPAHELAWAMTVHKSQGSEFDAVVLILPESNQRRALTRELIYTGVTRARSHLSIYASEDALHIACQTLSQRHSGLSQKLGWAENSD